MTANATSIRIFSHAGLPMMSAAESQAIDLAQTNGLGVEVIDVDAEMTQAMAAGVLGLPAIVVYSGTTEIARRECAFAGRATRRWFDRKVASSTVAPALVPAMA